MITTKIKITDLLKYTRIDGTIVIGQLYPHGWDLGDYGINPTLTIEQPDGSGVCGIPVNKVEVITREEYEDLRFLNFGF